MPINIHGNQYVTVEERVREAGKDFIALNTEILSHNPVVIKATVTTTKGTFTGTSYANVSKQIEKVSPYEVAETSAVGRALGFAGYGIVDGIASADEIVKAQSVEQTAPTTIPGNRPWCDYHKCEMRKGFSALKKKAYEYHDDTAKGRCFGTGYQSERDAYKQTAPTRTQPVTQRADDLSDEAMNALVNDIPF